jgi:hypothetical protein
MWEPEEIKTYREPSKPFVDGLVGPVTIPLLQAVITGGLAAVCAFSLVLVFRMDVSALAVAGVVFAVVTFGAWMSYRGRWQWVIEKYLGVDLDRDGFIGQPEPVHQLPPLRVIVEEDQGRHAEFIDLPYPEKLPQLAAGLLAGRTFNQTAWTGHAGIFSRAEFDSLRDTMIERGLLVWKNPEAKAQGVVLTAPGRAVMRRLADVPSPTGQE